MLKKRVSGPGELLIFLIEADGLQFTGLHGDGTLYRRGLAR